MAIGIFDSGIGGMTVVKELRKRLPKENIIYFGDTLRVPYGGRDNKELSDLAFAATEFLIGKGVDVIIDACNTTSAIVHPHLKKKFSIPILSVLLPGARGAARITKGKIGVIATVGTVNSHAYRNEIKKIDKNIQVFEVGCPGLVEYIERGELDSLPLRNFLKGYLDELLKESCDTIILGCTHYPFLKDLIVELVGDDVMVFDPATEVVSDALELEYTGKVKEECYVSLDSSKFLNNLDDVFPEHGFERVEEVDPLILKKILFATRNRHKVMEFKKIVNDLNIVILSLNDLRFKDEIEETGETFLSNAKIKAEAVYNFFKIPTVGDDSGLNIDALPGELGIRTARFMELMEQSEKNELILELLQEVPEKKRSAHYACALYYIDEFGNGHFTEDILEGYIGLEQRGDNGFGYDPIFYLKNRKISVAEISEEEKNKISHRGKALIKLKDSIL